MTRLRELLEENNIMQKDVAEAIGYLPKTAAALAAFVLTFALIAVTWPYLGALAVLFGLSAPGYFAVKMILPAFKEQEEKQR